MNNAGKYVSEIDDIFRNYSNSAKALEMKNYMRGRFEFLGINSPLRREITKKLFTKENRPEISEIKSVINLLWQKTFREYHYLAIELLRKYIKQIDSDYIDLMEYMIVTNSWWDSVDGIAINLVGPHFKRFHHLKKPYSKKWINSDNIWLLRTAILFQLKYKTDTDTKQLFNTIKKLSGSDEFFIKKAIGWALREYSKINPEMVIKFVEQTELSLLSKKEALRVIK